MTNRLTVSFVWVNDLFIPMTTLWAAIRKLVWWPTVWKLSHTKYETKLSDNPPMSLKKMITLHTSIQEPLSLWSLLSIVRANLIYFISISRSTAMVWQANVIRISMNWFPNRSRLLTKLSIQQTLWSRVKNQCWINLFLVSTNSYETSTNCDAEHVHKPLILRKYLTTAIA